MKYTLLLLGSLVFLLLACDSLRQEVEPRGILAEPEKLVVACFISPQDTLLTAKVTRSSPLLGTSNSTTEEITNAIVTLSDGNRTVTLVRRTTNGVGPAYLIKASELPIAAGKTYSLRVDLPDGRSVSSRCTVPGPVSLDAVTIDSSNVFEDGQSYYEYFARLQWRDPASSPNFYRVAGNNESDYTYSLSQPARDTTVRYWLDWRFDTNTNLTDQGRDGQLMQSARVPLTFVYFRDSGQLRITRPRGQLNAYLLNVDENYYRYHDAVERQTQNSDNSFAEPVLIPTNIQGGLGCFGAFNRSTLTRQLK